MYVHIFHSPTQTMGSNLRPLQINVKPWEPNLGGLMTISLYQTWCYTYVKIHQHSNVGLLICFHIIVHALVDPIFSLDFKCFASHNDPLTSKMNKYCTLGIIGIFTEKEAKKNP